MKYLLFDLDGTIVDPFEGITKGFQYSLNFYGIKEKQENLTKFIGPPLYVAFTEYYGFDDEKTKRAIEKYREYYSKNGITQNKIYNGIEKLFQEIKASDKKIILATSKPIEFAEKIIAHFGLTNYFDFMAGCNLKGDRNTKTEVITYALEQMHITDKSEAIMIGDRMHDIIGAHENDIECIAVEYGYGNAEEFKEYNADYICESIDSLRELIFKI